MKVKGSLWVVRKCLRLPHHLTESPDFAPAVSYGKRVIRFTEKVIWSEGPSRPSGRAVVAYYVFRTINQ